MTTRKTLAALALTSLVACGPQNDDPGSDPAVSTEALTAPTQTRLSMLAATSSPGRLVNVSTRLAVGTGENVGIAGFIISGSGSRHLVLRALGPTLTAFGVPGVLANPTLELHGSQGVVASNDDWQSGTSAAAVQASGLAPGFPAEAAIDVTLPAGAYTAIVSGASGSTGIAIVEVYDVDPSTAAPLRLVNLSTRGEVLTGAGVMIGGFVISGTKPLNVLIRGIGPSLAPAGIAHPLADPTLRLFSRQTLVASNDDWNLAANAGAIVAMGLAPANHREAAIFTQLAPGAYTVQVIGAGPDPTGVALVEIYERTESPLVRFAGCTFAGAGAGSSCQSSAINPPALWQYVGCMTADSGASCAAAGTVPYAVLTQPPADNTPCPSSPYLVIAPGNGYCACPAGTVETRTSRSGAYGGSVDCYR